MSALRPLLTAVLLWAALPSAAQTVPPEPAPPGPASGFLLERFVRDATAFTALPWQRDVLALSPAQVAALRGLAEEYGPTVEDLYAELRMLFENVGRLERPVEAHEAFALYYDIAAHKAEALMTFHEAAEAMRAVLTAEQRARWEAVLEEATCEQCGPIRADAVPGSPPAPASADR